MPAQTNVVPGIPAIPDAQVEDKNLQATLDALKEAVEVLTGSRGNPNSRAVTVGEATENGQTDLFVTNRVSETAQNGAQSARLSGDIVGTGLFEEGAVVVPTAIQLPNIIRIDGGAPDTSYTSQLAGPYGIEGTPEGGTTGQVFGKLSDTDFDYGWIDQSGGGGAGLPTGGTAGQLLIKQSATNGDAEWETFGPSSAANTEYAPGYTSYTQYSTTAFTVDLVNAEHLFYVGRRVKIGLSGSYVYGRINTVNYNSTAANDTYVALTMESGTVPATIDELFLVSSDTQWSPIAGDPFSGDSINAISAGAISGTVWWVAVGDNGKIATSTDAGVSWTIRTSGTTEHLNSVRFHTDDSTFYAGGDAGVFLNSTNGSSWTLDTTTFPALVGAGGTADIWTVLSHPGHGLSVAYNGSTGYSNWVSKIPGGSWTNRGAIFAGATNLHHHSGTAEPNGASTFSDNTRFSVASYGLQLLFTTMTDATASGSGSHSAGSTVAYAFYKTGLNYVSGGVNGFTGISGWTGDDAGAVITEDIRCMVWSATHDRLVGGCTNGQLWYWDHADKATSGTATIVSNGFTPTATINSIEWNATDGIFIAVANNGQICRSSNGTS